MKKLSIVVGAMLALVAVPVVADVTYNCTHGDQSRVITVKYDVQGQSVPCEVHYDKASGSQMLWRAEGQAGYCEEKAADFVAKQEGWGWSCSSDDAGMVEKAVEATSDAAEEMADKAGDAMEAAKDGAEAMVDKAADAVEKAAE